MLKHEYKEGSNNSWKTENNKVIERGNIHFENIKEALQRSQKNKEGFQNINKLRTWSKKKRFKSLLSWKEHKLKWVIAKLPHLTNTQNFQKADIERVKKDKRGRILWELGSIKKSLLCNLLSLMQIS